MKKELIKNKNGYEIKITLGSKRKTNIYSNVFMENSNSIFNISVLTAYDYLNNNTDYVYIRYRSKENNKNHFDKEISRKEFEDITRIDHSYILIQCINFIDTFNLDASVYKYL